MGDYELLVARRSAAGLDLDDTEAVRAWVVGEVERASLAPNEPTLWFFIADRVEVVSCAEPEHRDRVLSFAFAQWSARAEVIRAFWLGDARMVVEGGRRRAVCVLERARDGAWWTAWRLVRFDPTLRQTSFIGPWQGASGGLGEPMGAPFDDWIAPALLAAGATEADVRVSTGQLETALPGSVHRVLEDVAYRLARHTLDEGGLDCDLIAVFRDLEFRLWEIRGVVPAPFDDLVCTLARGADAVVVLRADEAGVLAVAERGRDRAALRFTSAAGELRARSVPTGERQWLGVPPRTPISLHGASDLGWGGAPGDS